MRASACCLHQHAASWDSTCPVCNAGRQPAADAQLQPLERPPREKHKARPQTGRVISATCAHLKPRASTLTPRPCCTPMLVCRCTATVDTPDGGSVGRADVEVTFVTKAADGATCSPARGKTSESCRLVKLCLLGFASCSACWQSSGVCHTHRGPPACMLQVHRARSPPHALSQSKPRPTLLRALAGSLVLFRSLWRHPSLALFCLTRRVAQPAGCGPAIGAWHTHARTCLLTALHLQLATGAHACVHGHGVRDGPRRMTQPTWWPPRCCRRAIPSS